MDLETYRKAPDHREATCRGCGRRFMLSKISELMPGPGLEPETCPACEQAKFNADVFGDAFDTFDVDLDRHLRELSG